MESFVSLHKKKAEEILDLCMTEESPQMRARVYEIIGLSGIKPNDPLFLVLALTGQIRVLLEVAPKELRELLEVWKSQVSNSIEDLSNAIALVKEAQELQVENIQQNISEINSKNIEDINNLHRSLVGEILATNLKIEDKVKLSVEEIQASVREVENAREQLREDNLKLQEERNTNVKVIKSLIEGLSRTTKDLELANAQISSSVSTLDRLKLSKFLNKGIILGSLVSVFVFGSLITLGMIKLLDTPQQTSSISTPIIPVSSSQRREKSVFFYKN